MPDTVSQTPPPILNYAATSRSPWPPSKLLIIGAIENLFVLFFAAITLDGGGLLKIAFGMTGCYWLITARILHRRRNSLTRFDRLFLVAGPIALVVPVGILLGLLFL